MTLPSFTPPLTHQTTPPTTPPTNQPHLHFSCQQIELTYEYEKLKVEGGRENLRSADVTKSEGKYILTTGWEKKYFYKHHNPNVVGDATANAANVDAAANDDTAADVDTVANAANIDAAANAANVDTSANVDAAANAANVDATANAANADAAANVPITPSTTTLYPTLFVRYGKGGFRYPSFTKYYPTVNKKDDHTIDVLHSLLNYLDIYRKEMIAESEGFTKGLDENTIMKLSFRNKKKKMVKFTATNIFGRNDMKGSSIVPHHNFQPNHFRLAGVGNVAEFQNKFIAAESIPAEFKFKNKDAAYAKLKKTQHSAYCRDFFNKHMGDLKDMSFCRGGKQRRDTLKKSFANHISTDGVWVTMLFEIDTPPTTSTTSSFPTKGVGVDLNSSTPPPVELGENDVVWGIDPGRRDMITAVLVHGPKWLIGKVVKMSAKQHAFESGRTFRSFNTTKLYKKREWRTSNLQVRTDTHSLPFRSPTSLRPSGSHFACHQPPSSPHPPSHPHPPSLSGHIGEVSHPPDVLFK